MFDAVHCCPYQHEEVCVWGAAALCGMGVGDGVLGGLHPGASVQARTYKWSRGVQPASLQGVESGFPPRNG